MNNTYPQLNELYNKAFIAEIKAKLLTAMTSLMEDPQYQKDECLQEMFKILDRVEAEEAIL